MNYYKKGYYAERKLIEEQYSKGAVYCTRSAGSHTPIDVLAFYKDHVDLFQVKFSKRKISPKEKKKLQELATYMPKNCRVFIAYRVRGGFYYEQV